MSILSQFLRTFVRGSVRGSRHIVRQYVNHQDEIQSNYCTERSTDIYDILSFFIYAIVVFFIVKLMIKNKEKIKPYLNVDVLKEKLKFPKDYGHLFWVDGHVGRATFLLYSVVICVLIVIFSILLNRDLFFISLCVFAFTFICLYVKRIHDLGFSGYWVWAYIVLYMSSNATLSHVFLLMLTTLPLFLLKGSRIPYEAKKQSKDKTKSSKIKGRKVIRIIIFIGFIYALIIMGFILKDYYK